MNLRAFCDLQVDLVAHPEKFYASVADLLVNAPVLTYTTTTENIFKSNIETIRTIGNILFVETVSGESRAVENEKIFQESFQRNAALQKAREEGRKALGQD